MEGKKSQTIEQEVDENPDITKRKHKNPPVKKIKSNGSHSSDEEFKPSEIKLKPIVKKVIKKDGDNDFTLTRDKKKMEIGQ
jgi:hypothetical protein